MVNISAKFKEFFNRNGRRRGGGRGSRAPSPGATPAPTSKKGAQETQVLSAQVHIYNQLLYIRNRPVPFHLQPKDPTMGAPNTIENVNQTRVQSRNGSVVLYAITIPASGNMPTPPAADTTGRQTPEASSAENTTYEMVLEVLPLQDLEITLLLTKDLEVGIALLTSPAMTILNRFVPYLVECESRSTAFTTVVELLECFIANPSWTVHHFAAYFNWESHFISPPNPIPLEELENTANPGCWSVLHVAVSCSSRRLLEALLATGLNVNLVEAQGATVMHYAVQVNRGNDKEDIVGFLIERPAFYEQLRTMDHEGQTPIHVAFLNSGGQHLGAVRRLLAQGLTAKMLNIGKPEVPKKESPPAYMDHSPYVNFTEDELWHCLAVDELRHGGNPLHWANDFDLLERLLKLQVFRVNGRNLQGDTPLIAFIRRLGAQEAACLDSTVVKITKKTIGKSPIRGGKKSGGGRTPLKAPGKPEAAAAWRQLASSRRHSHYRLSWILRLLTAGGRVNATNHQTGETALHYAVLAHDIASIQALIIFGSRINLRDKAGVSALHTACVQLKGLIGSEKEQKQGPQKSGKYSGGKKPSPANLSANDARTAVHYNQIIRLLVESGARRCPPQNQQPASNTLDDSGISGISLHQPPANSHCGPECQHMGGSKASKSETYVKVEIRSVDDHCRLRLIRKGRDGPSSKITQPQQLKKGNSLKQTSSTSITTSSRVSVATKVRTPSPSNKSTTSKKSPPEGEGCKTSTQTTPSIKIEGPKVQSSKKNKQKSQSPIFNPSSVNMIALDGGDSHAGIRPLIQALILNELEHFLLRPLHAYFTVVGGASFGATVSALLSTRRTAAEIFYFFLRLKEAFKLPVLPHMAANGAHLETVLKREFGAGEQDDGLRLEQLAAPPYGKHLMLLSTLVDREPVVQNIFTSYRYPQNSENTSSSSEESANPYLWWACRAASCSLYSYATFHGHYDNGLHASNPTMDVLAKYEASRAELKVEASKKSGTPPSKQLPPLHMVLSIGCGSKPVQLNTSIKELGVGPLSFRFLDVPYIIQLRDVCFEVITQQNGFIAERAAVWAGSLGAIYGRLNFSFTKPRVAAEEAAKRAKKAKNGPVAKRVPSEGRPDKAYLGKVTAGTLRSAPAAPIVDEDGHLLQVLWAIKLQMLARKSFFARVAKALEQWITEQ